MSLHGIVLPSPIQIAGLAGGQTAYSTLILDATAEKAAAIFRAPKAGNIARVGFRTVTVTTGDTLRVSLQDLDGTSGDPDGTADQFRTQVVGDGDDNVWFRSGLLTDDGTDTGALRTVTRGQWLAVVIEFSSWVAGNLQIAHHSATSVAMCYGQGNYTSLFVASWARQNGFVPVMAVEYDDGSFAFLPGVFPALSMTNLAMSSATTPDEAGIIFTLPAPQLAEGCWVSPTKVNNADFDVVLYDGDGSTPLVTMSVDEDYGRAAGYGGPWPLFFPTDIQLQADIAYRLVYKPTTTTNAVLMHYEVERAGIMDQLDGGQAIHWTQRTDGGAWSEITTRRPAMGLFLRQDAAAGGGGLSRARVVNAGGI